MDENKMDELLKEITDPEFIWIAMDDVHDFDTSDVSKFMKRRIKEILGKDI